jgi:SAM-dependent methyltransferase
MLPTVAKKAILWAFPALSRFIGSWKRHFPYDVRLWERFYGTAEDPYALSTGVGEDRKYAFTLALCGDGPFQRALEIGCSIGLFSVMLAPRCAQLLAVDISQTAVDRARIRTADFPQATFQRLSMPLELPSGPFDLIVCSDVLYYWPEQDLRRALPTIAHLLAPAGRFVVLHWLGTGVLVSSGTRVHDILRASMPLAHVEGGEQDFRRDGSAPWRYDVFEKRNG